MLLKLLISVVAPIAYSQTKQKEKRLGFVLNFNNLTDDWLPSKVIYEMDKIWQSEGLDAVGTNYFTIGKIEKNISTRFDPNSAFYQSWLGGYIVKFNENRNWTIMDHFKLGVADQKNWLKTYEDKDPVVAVDEQSVENLGELELHGFKGTLYRGTIHSDSDVSDRKISFFNRGLITGLAYYINQENKKQTIQPHQLMPNPQLSALVLPFQHIKLRGYIAILDLPSNTKVVLYANAANYTDLTGKDHKNFEKIDKVLLNSLRNIEIKKISG